MNNSQPSGLSVSKAADTELPVTVQYNFPMFPEPVVINLLRVRCGMNQLEKVPPVTSVSPACLMVTTGIQ